MQSSLRMPMTLLGAAVLAGCASLPPSRGYDETSALLEVRRDIAPVWSKTVEEAVAYPTGPIDAEDAVGLAFANNPLVHEHYARLGLSRAELEDARRLPNPRFSFGRRSSSEGGRDISRSVSLGLSDLLLVPARKRLAEGELDRAQHQAAAALIELAARVEQRWYRAVAAAQVAEMRRLVARSADQAATLAQRFFDAGNISRLQLEQELAAAAQTGIALWRAEAEALRARAALAEDMGLPLAAEWTLPDRLPAPSQYAFDSDLLLALAQEQRLDLLAAKQSLQLHEDALKLVRRWRWFGDVELEYERESESDGSRLRGPGLSLALPIFNQGQGDRLRAEAELHRARANYDALLLAVRNDTRTQLDRVEIAARITERYRDDLVPRREAIVARTQERQNYMLVGVFELIAARQQEFDAYQEYLEAVRDYWMARSELRAVVGGRLPEESETTEPGIGVNAVLPPPQAAMDHSQHEAMDHSQHRGMDHSDSDSSTRKAAEPHHHHQPHSEGDQP